MGVSTKALPNCFIKIKYQIPSSLQKKGYMTEVVTEWKYMFKLPYVSTTKTPLQALEYWTIHTLLVSCTSSKNGYDITLTNSNKCDI